MPTSEIKPVQRAVQIGLKGHLKHGDIITLYKITDIREPITQVIVGEYSNGFLSLYYDWKGDVTIEAVIVNKDYKPWKVNFIVPHYGCLVEVINREELNEEEKKQVEFVNSVLVANEMSGYKFGCVGEYEGNTCRACAVNFVNFTTNNIEEAYLHSRDNDMPFWISKD